MCTRVRDLHDPPYINGSATENVDIVDIGEETAPRCEDSRDRRYFPRHEIHSGLLP